MGVKVMGYKITALTLVENIRYILEETYPETNEVMFKINNNISSDFCMHFSDINENPILFIFDNRLDMLDIINNCVSGRYYRQFIDKSLINSNINSHYKYHIFTILHEFGHYIGIRRKEVDLHIYNKQFRKFQELKSELDSKMKEKKTKLIESENTCNSEEIRIAQLEYEESETNYNKHVLVDYRKINAESYADSFASKTFDNLKTKLSFMEDGRQFYLYLLGKDFVITREDITNFSDLQPTFIEKNNSIEYFYENNITSKNFSKAFRIYNITGNTLPEKEKFLIDKLELLKIKQRVFNKFNISPLKEQ